MLGDITVIALLLEMNTRERARKRQEDRAPPPNDLVARQEEESMETESVEVVNLSDEEETPPKSEVGSSCNPRPPKRFTDEYVNKLKDDLEVNEKKAQDAVVALEQVKKKFWEVKDRNDLQQQKFQKWYEELKDMQRRNEGNMSRFLAHVRQIEQNGDKDLDIVNRVIIKAKEQLGGAEVPSEVVEYLIRSLKKSRRGRVNIREVNNLVGQSSAGQ